MENILGYCQPGNFDKKVDLPPPPYDAAITQNTEPLELPLSGNLELSENDVYEALLNHVSKFICYGKGVVKEMIIIKMEQFYAYRHSLETFTENRQVCWSYEPYAGGHIDGPLMKQCYDPWEITVDPLRQFDRHNVKLIMPHTEMLQACPDCGGAGRIECAFCHGKGKMTCNTCNGSGYTFGFSGEDRQMCVHCFSGTVTCAHCKGKGIHGCSICSEAGEIKCYVQLIVHWNNYTDSSLIEHSSDIPKDILKKATGELVYDEINDRQSDIYSEIRKIRVSLIS
ncbi:protein SSUH2 homolog isoform X2 [Tetranychus urticae]|uniref:CR-type domain-containing protein n=1 Tax=Tetranychus urticae TaxID=32264 RepID=T1K4P8_TETUR|nr:protein SSUH2 homolog isoform X2 [Tetranychus urticae]